MRSSSRAFGLILVGVSLALAGCSANKSGGKHSRAFNSKGESLAGFAGTGSVYFKGSGPLPKGGGKYHIGKPYQVAGKWFHPKSQPGYDKQGVASWYGEAFHRRRTSNGEYFDMNMLSAAHPTLPLPSYAKVTNLENGKSIIVRINDRGPFVGTRIIDLSKRSADSLDFRHNGKADVRVQWIGNAPLNDKGSHLAMMNRKLQNGAGLKVLVAAAAGKNTETVQIANAEPKQVKKNRLLQEASYQPDQKVEYAGSYVVRVASFTNPANAQAVYDQVSAFGPAQVFETASGDYKVQLGPFRSKLGAEDALESIRSQGFPDAVLVKAKLEFVAAGP